jgi:hypothetical protein
VGSRARQQRPSPTDSGPVERSAIFVLAITVLVVTSPEGPLGHLDPEQRVDHPDGVP